MLYQQQRKLGDAKKIVEQGLAEFPGSFDLTLCQAINHMNSGDFQSALELLRPHKDQAIVQTYMGHCLQALGLSEK